MKYSCIHFHDQFFFKKIAHICYHFWTKHQISVIISVMHINFLVEILNQLQLKVLIFPGFWIACKQESRICLIYQEFPSSGICNDSPENSIPRKISSSRIHDWHHWCQPDSGITKIPPCSHLLREYLMDWNRSLDMWPPQPKKEARYKNMWAWKHKRKPS